MLESGYYPEGTEYDKQSPWNKEPGCDKISKQEFLITETLSSVKTLEYVGDKDINDLDEEEIEELLCEQEFSTIDLLDKLKEYLLKDLKYNKKLTKEQQITKRKMINTIDSYSADNYKIERK